MSLMGPSKDKRLDIMQYLKTDYIKLRIMNFDINFKKIDLVS